MGKKKTVFEKTNIQLSNKWHFVENITKYYAVFLKNIANLLVSLLHKMYFWGCFSYMQSLFNPFPVQFKSLVPGQKSRVFSRDI